MKYNEYLQLLEHIGSLNEVNADTTTDSSKQTDTKKEPKTKVVTADTVNAVKGAIAEIKNIKSGALLKGAISTSGIVAWLFRRGIIRLAWIAKFKNNVADLKNKIVKMLELHGKDMLGKKNELLKKLSLVEQKEKELANVESKKEQVKKTTGSTSNINTASTDKSKTKETAPETADVTESSFNIFLDNVLNEATAADASKRLAEIKSQLQQQINEWDAQFVKVIEKAITQTINDRTKLLNARINENKKLKNSQKLSLQNVWSLMAVNLKAMLWNVLTNAKVVTGEEVLKEIDNFIKKEQSDLDTSTKKLKQELETKYKDNVKKLSISDVPLKFDSWYLYDKKTDNDVVGNLFVKFTLDPNAMADGEEKYMALIVDVKQNDKTGKISLTKRGEYNKDDELEKIVKNAKLTTESQPVDINKASAPKKEE